MNLQHVHGVVWKWDTGKHLDFGCESIIYAVLYRYIKSFCGIDLRSVLFSPPSYNEQYSLIDAIACTA